MAQDALKEAPLAGTAGVFVARFTDDDGNFTSREALGAFISNALGGGLGAARGLLTPLANNRFRKVLGFAVEGGGFTLGGQFEGTINGKDISTVDHAMNFFFGGFGGTLQKVMSDAIAPVTKHVPMAQLTDDLKDVFEKTITNYSVMEGRRIFKEHLPTFPFIAPQPARP